MRLSHLSLTNFRNFVRLEAEFPPGPTLLVGANAQGKTSLLEAIYYLTGAQSPHTTSDRQLINFLALREPTPFARVVGEVRRGDRLHRIEVRLVLEPEGPVGEGRLRKEVLVNGLKRRVRDLAGGFNAVLFLPQDVAVVEGSPGMRRRYLDAALSQADPTYAAALAEYAKVLAQRNALLKRLQERRNSEAQLAFWDEQLCTLAAALIRARALALHELESLATEVHRELTGGERLRLVYLPAFDPAARPEGQLDLPLEAAVDRTGFSLGEIEAGMRQALARSRQEEIAQGATLIGPHRDDLRLLANGLDLRLYGSRGQNRTAMLALKLAEVEWLRRRSGEAPVLLLDEVLAELDAARREQVLARVFQVEQAVLTAADLEMFTPDFRARATLWRVEAGKVTALAEMGGGPGTGDGGP